MKEIFVRAYYQTNLGDDLFVLQLAKRYPEHKFIAYAVPPNQRAFSTADNISLPTFGDRVRKKLVSKLKLPLRNPFAGADADMTVTIGGSILWENVDISFGEKSMPRFLIGANCENSYSPGFYSRLREELSQLDSCCFRDSHSYEMFKDLPNVSWAPDVLFDWEPSCAEMDGKGIAVSVISPERKRGLPEQQENYYSAIANLCDICQRKGIPISLLGFCEAEGDGESIRRILKLVKDPQYPKSIVYNGDVDAMMDAINECETVVATRFHAMILGWVMKKNVVPVIYSVKQSQVLDDTGFSGPIWNLMAGEPMSGELLLDAVQANTGCMDITPLKEKAGEQFRALDAVLGKET